MTRTTAAALKGDATYPEIRSESISAAQAEREQETSVKLLRTTVVAGSTGAPMSMPLLGSYFHGHLVLLICFRA